MLGNLNSSENNQKMDRSIFPSFTDQEKRRYSSLVEIEQKNPHILTGYDRVRPQRLREKLMEIEDSKI